MNHWKTIENKFKTTEQLKATINSWHENDQSIVFTNGCFDLLHMGHLNYLARAADLGNKLVIGLNSDLSVKKLKGPKRPIKDENTRAHILAALSFVDVVCLFTEETPLNLIKAVKPNILVKGGDYEKDKVVGYDFVKSIGGKTIILTFVEGFSTTNYIKKIKHED